MEESEEENIKDRIESYYLVLQEELDSTRALNLDLRRENRKKDILIESNEAHLKSLRDVSAIDVQRHELVRKFDPPQQILNGS
jgi:hypothetical protein